MYEAGGGEQDGWEQAERDLIENASHGDGHGNPLRDALEPEVESDLSGAEYGEADHWEGPDEVLEAGLAGAGAAPRGRPALADGGLCRAATSGWRRGMHNVASGGFSAGRATLCIAWMHNVTWLFEIGA